MKKKGREENKVMPIMEERDKDRFWSKVAITANPKSCWEWTSGLSNRRYGSILIKRKRYLAHRIAYFLSSNLDPQDLLVLHSCDVRHCTNPNHLFIGTSKDNTQDMIKKGRRVQPNMVEVIKRHPDMIKRGEEAGRARLTEVQVLSIRKEHDEGVLSDSGIARKYHVHPATIQFIVQRRNWKHI